MAQGGGLAWPGDMNPHGLRRWIDMASGGGPRWPEEQTLMTRGVDTHSQGSRVGTDHSQVLPPAAHLPTWFSQPMSLNSLCVSYSTGHPLSLWPAQTRFDHRDPPAPLHRARAVPSLARPPNWCRPEALHSPSVLSYRSAREF